MADETQTGPQGATSKASVQPVKQEVIPEPKILEEVIIKKEKPPRPKAEPVPATVSPPPSSAEPAPLPEVPHPSALPIERSAGHDIGADIAKILQSTKLPERVENAKTTADVHANSPRTPTPLQQAIAKQAEDPNALETVVTPRSAEKKTDIMTPVHTLKDDLRGVVRDTKLSVVRAVALEADRHTQRSGRLPENAGKTQRSNRTFAILFSAVLLLVLGGGAVFGVYAIMSQRVGQPAPSISSSILFAESVVTLSIDNQSPDSLKHTIASALQSGQGTLGSITEIVPLITATSTSGTLEQRPATFGEFMQALGTHIPDDLVRSLSSEFFFGIHTVDTNAPLFVIPVVSYDHAFAGMLTWEATINTDLAPIFTAVPVTTKDQNGLPIVRTFTDAQMSNYDVRELKDDSGNIVLYYSFPTQNILVIAESPYSFTEILNRLEAKGEL